MTHPRLTLAPLLPGDAGTWQTLRLMRELARRPGPRTMQWARLINTGDPESTLAALHAFLVRNVRWTRDVGVELLHDPDTLLGQWPAVAGDCDDAAILAAALGMALGFRAKFRAVAVRHNQPFHHVYALLRAPAGWRRFDVTHPHTAPTPDAARLIELEV